MTKLLINANQERICEACNGKVWGTPTKCPYCGSYFDNVIPEWAVGMYEKQKAQNEMQKETGKISVKLGVIFFFIFLITVIYALLNIFVFNNFQIDLYFILGMSTIVFSLFLYILVPKCNIINMVLISFVLDLGPNCPVPS